MQNKSIDKIAKKIKEKHKQFLSQVGEIPYKVSADHALLLTMVSTKISLIATLLRDSEVIDDFKWTNHGEYNEILLFKRGLDFKINLVTDGKAILMKPASYLIEVDSDFLPKQWYKPSKEGWDWEDFTEQLMDFIHFTMYKSQKSEEIDLDDLMKGLKI